MSPAAGFAALAAAWTLGMLALGVGDAFIYLAPAMLILLPLLAGRYPGDRALTRAASRARARTPRAAAAPPRKRAATGLLPRGGDLVAFSLAGRGPPAAPRIQA